MPDDDAVRRLQRTVEGQDWRGTGHLRLRGLGHALLRTAPPVDLDGLISLDLSGNGLRGLPAWVHDVVGLEALDLSANELAGDLQLGLPRLQRLDLSGNGFTSVPDGLAAMPALRWLSLADNRLRELGAGSASVDLPALADLNLAGNRLVSLRHLPGTATLRSLTARANALADLWEPGIVLPELRVLDLSRNRLGRTTVLEVVLGSPLEELHLDFNRLTRLPSSFTVWGMRSVTAAGNPLDLSGSDDATRQVVAAGRGMITWLDGLTSGGDETGEQDPGAPEIQFDFKLHFPGLRAATELANLYYTSGDRPEADLRLSSGKVLGLRDVERWEALELIAANQEPEADATLEFAPVRGLVDVSPGITLAAEAITRVSEVELVTKEGGARRFEQPDLARVVNVTVGKPESPLAPVTTSLATRTEYLLRIWLGPGADESIVVNPFPLPLPSLEPSAGGWWFDVVVSSASVTLTREASGRIFLPFRGPGWVCTCVGEGEHACTPRERRASLDLPFLTGSAGAAVARCTVYHRGTVVQSVRVDLPVSDPLDDSSGSGPKPRARVDYSLSADLAMAASLPERQVSVLTNDAPSATHTVVVKGSGLPAVVTHLADAAVSSALDSVRSLLTQITLTPDAEHSRYGPDNSAPVEQFKSDLARLARVGSVLWQAAVPEISDQLRLDDLLREPAVIQVARVTRAVFPWAAVYDPPNDLGAWRACALLNDWPQAQEVLAAAPDACPYADTHAEVNALCPFGFWGVRHVIEEPPSLARGVESLVTEIPLPSDPRVVAARALTLDADLSRSHLADVAKAFAPQFTLDTCDSVSSLKNAVASAVPLLYFYCHGKTATVGTTKQPLRIPYLELGTDERFTADSLKAWARAHSWDPQLWRDVPPLVFINGCETAAFSPEDVVTVVDGFAGLSAAGILGTQVPVAQRVASEFAATFFECLMSAPGMTVGRALRTARFRLLAKGNLAGFVYTGFCSADLAFS